MTQLSDGGNWMGKVSILNFSLPLLEACTNSLPHTFNFVVYLHHSAVYKVLKKILSEGG